jgi:hypothetical protein
MALVIQTNAKGLVMSWCKLYMILTTGDKPVDFLFLSIIHDMDTGVEFTVYSTQIDAISFVYPYIQVCS